MKFILYQITLTCEHSGQVKQQFTRAFPNTVTRHQVFDILYAEFNAPLIANQDPQLEIEAKILDAGNFSQNHWYWQQSFAGSGVH